MDNLRKFYILWNLLYTGTEGEPAVVTTELNTIPHILSTQLGGVPLWAKGKSVLVAHGIVNQSVVQPEFWSSDPIMDPCAETPPVILKDDGNVFTDIIECMKIEIKVLCFGNFIILEFQYIIIEFCHLT